MPAGPSPLQDVLALEMDVYAQHLSDMGKPNMLARVIDIQYEFVSPYGELRYKPQHLKVWHFSNVLAR